MYTEFYKLGGKPFQLSPNPRFFFGSQGHQKALAYLRYGIHQGEGFIVITGDIGAGKTTLLGYLLEQLDATQYLAAKLVTTQIEADDTLRMVASAFGIEAHNVDKATLLRKFEAFLLDNQRRGRRVLLLVDEAQNLPMRSLEELRMLSNFQTAELAPIQICLLGQPQFQQILASQSLVQLRQRVIASYHLGPLSVEETRTYIEHRLRLVDWQADPVITDEAFSRIHHFTSGTPRQINTLCDRLLLYGMLEELHHVDEDAVEKVASELSSESAHAWAGADGAERQPHNGRPLASGVGGPGFLEDRVAALERLVQVHDKTIKRGIELATRYLSGPTATETTASDKESET